jgi:glycosyltransferase involved in cell wall biosynthesis
MATVGVIIPAFNAAKTLPIALQSVASQTFDDWQILLVDDGSTDNTAEVVAPFLTRFGPKILYIKQQNRGLPWPVQCGLWHSIHSISATSAPPHPCSCVAPG